MKKTLRTIAAAMIVIAGTTLASFAAVEDMYIENILAGATNLAERNIMVRIHGVLVNETLTMVDDGSGMVEIESRGDMTAFEDGSPVVVTGLVAVDGSRVFVNVDAIEMALVKSRRTPAAFDETLSATLNVGNEMYRLQEVLQVKGGVVDRLLEDKYVQLVDELEAYNQSIARTVMNGVRNGSTTDMETMRNFMENLQSYQKGFFSSAIFTLDEEMKNLDYNGEVLMADSMGLMRELSVLLNS